MTTHSDYSRDSYPANKHILQTVKGVKGHLLCRIFWASNLKDGVCRMGLKRLGSEIGFDASTCSRAGAQLVEEGYILKVKEADLTTSSPPHYVVTQKFYDLLPDDTTPIAERNSPIAHSNTPIAERKQEKDKDIENKAAAPTKNPQNKPTQEQLQHKELALKLSTIMGYDKLPIKAVVKDLNTLTKWLVGIGATAADVEQFGRYWWGDKPPSPYQVKSYWAQAMAQKQAAGKSNITPLPGVAEAIRRIEAQNG